MTLIQPIVASQHHVVADIVDIRVIILAWSDVDILERPVETWVLLRTVHPGYTILSGRTCKVREVDIGPPDKLASPTKT